MSGKPSTWTAERVEQVKTLLKETGGDLTSVAKRIGVTVRVLRSMLVDKGIEYRAMRGLGPLEVTAAPKVTWPPEGYEPQHAKPAKAKPDKTFRSVVLADAHRPRHLQSAWDCAIGIIKDAKPDRVIINGDFLDLESLSRHPKSRPDLTRLSSEFYDGNMALDEVQNAAPGSETVLCEGNHENRAARYANEYGELDGMLSVPVSLYIEPRAEYHRETSNLRGIRWIPLRAQPFALGNVRYLHGVSETKYHSAFHAEALGPRNPEHVLISAHMHGWQSFASASGYIAYSCPWLGDESQAVFQAYVKGRPRPWHLGVLLVEESGASVTVTPIFISNGRALVGGHVIQAAA